MIILVDSDRHKAKGYSELAGLAGLAEITGLRIIPVQAIDVGVVCSRGCSKYTDFSCSIKDKIFEKNDIFSR